MNLQTHIPKALWDAVNGPYLSDNYSHAILEATYYLSALIRDRAGVDGDGATLVGQALGGDVPRLRLNDLQTESDKNLQKGVEQMLRGLYIGIRNPRSHGQYSDTKETADAIIHFIAYIIGMISVSKEAFTMESFIGRLQDAEFVESERYAELIVAEIPALRMGDAVIALFHRRRDVDLGKLRFLVPALLSKLTANQTASYLGVVSEELRTTTDDATIRTALRMLSPELWPKLQELPRLRIENKLIAGIRKGEVQSSGKTIQALATWSNNFLASFTLRGDAAKALVERLEDWDGDARHYVAKFFFYYLPEIITTPYSVSRCVRAIASAVKNGDENLRSAVIGRIRHFPDDWQRQLVEELKEETDPENPAVVLDDGSPFLSAPENSEDDIPF